MFSEFEIVTKSFAGFGETEKFVVATSKVSFCSKVSVAENLVTKLSIKIVAAEVLVTIGATVVVPLVEVKSISSGSIAAAAPVI